MRALEIWYLASIAVFFTFLDALILIFTYEWFAHGGDWDGLFQAIVDHIGKAINDSPWLTTLKRFLESL